MVSRFEVFKFRLKLLCLAIVVVTMLGYLTIKDYICIGLEKIGLKQKEVDTDEIG